ncbi:MAG: hypothetical protein U0586_15630 [Candidatus Brocadiaceae bacterium]
MSFTKAVHITCRFCRGTGRDPFGIMSHLSTCCVCGGNGVIRIPYPYIRCAHCNSTGAIKTLTCTACMGKGVLPKIANHTKPCPLCHGSGDDQSVAGMYCLRCRGRGIIPINE